MNVNAASRTDWRRDDELVSTWKEMKLERHGFEDVSFLESST